jgi:hypothetical protein
MTIPSAVFVVVVSSLSPAPSSCTAFLHPTRRNVFFTRVTPSNDSNNEEASLSEIYDINNDNESSNSSFQPPMRKKFTGASSSTTSLFTTTTNKQLSPPSTTNLQREREREFNLASNFERTFGIQAVLLLAAFIYMTFVGLSGGISDGSDRNFYGEDEVDDVVIEQIERMRTDDAAEVFSRQSITITI